MANGAAENVAEVVADATGQAAAVAGNAVASVVADAEIAVAAATERADAAQAVAQAVTDAAVASQIGQQVADVREDLDEWENEVETALAALRSSMAELETTCRMMQERLTKLETPTVVTVVAAPETLASSTLPVPEPVATVVIDPTGQSANIPAALPETVPPRRRWL